MAMRTLDCWLIIFCTFCTMASNAVVSVNVAQICLALGHQARPLITAPLYMEHPYRL